MPETSAAPHEPLPEPGAADKIGKAHAWTPDPRPPPPSPPRPPPVRPPALTRAAAPARVAPPADGTLSAATAPGNASSAAAPAFARVANTNPPGDHAEDGRRAERAVAGAGRRV